MRPFASNLQRYCIRLPSKVRAFGIETRALQGSPIRSANLESRARNENADSSARASLGRQLVDCARRGKIGLVVDIEVVRRHDISSEHESIAVALAGADCGDVRRILKFADP